MRKISYCMFYLMTLFLVVGCQTVTSTADDEKKVSAAKINDRLGMAYMERHDVHRAKQKFLLALEEAPSIPEPWYSMAYFQEATGNHDKAKEYYLKAIKIAPHRGDVLNNYGTFLCRSGDYKGAIKEFMKAVHDADYLESSSAYENAGLCALKIPNKTQAKAFFIKAIEEDSMRPTSYIELATLNYKQGNKDLARQQLARFLELSQPTMQSYLLEKKLDSRT